MRSMQRHFGFAFLLAFSALSLLGHIDSAQSQTPVPSQQQLDIFRSLTPDQQDAILQQLGGSGSLGGLSSGTSGVGGQAQKDIEQQRLQQRQPPPTGEEVEPLIPVLKGQDWVVIEIDFHLEPRPVSLSLQSLYANSAVSAQSPQNLQAAQQALAGTPQALGPGQPAAAAAPGGTSQQETELTDDDKRLLRELMAQVRSKNPYQLSRDGMLYLPGFAGIALAGLTEDQATLRLKVVPAFRNIDIRLTRLPLKKTGAEGLRPFGYDLFSRTAAPFAPVTNIPVPADYIVGPGDELSVQLYGSQNRNLKLIVGRDGRVSFPELGPIEVGQQLFSQVKSTIESRVRRQIVGVQASVSMGETRSIRVFVLGEAKQPGSYTISGLGTMTSALYAAGGIKPIGSLRSILLKRQGTLVRTLDLYDLLIHGDTTDDTKLLQGDVIFIPPIGATVSVDGEVHRPAIYEIKRESSVADVLTLAGGLTAEADTSNAMVTRIDEQQHRVVIPLDFSAAGGKAEGVRNGDLLRVMRLRPTLDSGVSVEGHVFTPGSYAYRPGLRLSQVINTVDALQPNADIHYLLIRREVPPDRHISVVSADLAAALKAPGTKADLELMPRDRITVFDLASGRDRIVQPILNELRLQGSANQPSEVVRIQGRVKVPGEYPLEPGMTVSDLIRAGGGLTDGAYGGVAELTRYQVVNGESRRTERIDVDISAALHGDPSGNVRLAPFDYLSVKEVPNWEAQETVELKGEVRFPGSYPIKRGETLVSVIQRAGGLTDYAFAEGAVFTREELRKREQEQMDMLAQRMQRDLALLALQGAVANQAGAATALSVGQSLLGQLRAEKAVGRLVIDLPRTLHSSPGSGADIALRDGDSLIVPRFQQQVTVIGEVQNSTSHLYNVKLARDDYISQSGGMTRRADKKKIYIVHANGSVVAGEGSRWFESGANIAMKPGDTVVVPLDTERIPALPFWQAVTQIIYNVAIAAAAVHSF